MVNRVHPGLALYDLSTKTTSSSCTGKQLDLYCSPGNCKLSQPFSLVVIGDELYVGDKKQLVKIACKYHLWEVEFWVVSNPNTRGKCFYQIRVLENAEPRTVRGLSADYFWLMLKCVLTHSRTLKNDFQHYPKPFPENFFGTPDCPRTIFWKS